MIVTIKRPNLREQLSEQIAHLLAQDFGRDFQRIRSIQTFADDRLAYIIVEAQYGTFFEVLEMVWESDGGKWKCLWDGFTADGGYRLPVGKLTMRSFSEFLKEVKASS